MYRAWFNRYNNIEDTIIVREPLVEEVLSLNLIDIDHRPRDILITYKEASQLLKALKDKF